MNKSLPRTEVPWATHSWPILRGCSAASEGCRNCYAKEWHNRFAEYMKLPPWGEPHFLPENLDMPAHTKKPARVFVAPMGDLGHPRVEQRWRDEIVRFMHANQKHQYIVLTKRPGSWMVPFAPYAWLGVTAENQARAEERIPLLLQIPAVVRFVSVEPMLTPICINPWKDQLSWIICGLETGRKARYFDCAWSLNLERDCEQYGIPFYDKRGTSYTRQYPKGDTP